jgi:hypothetical protein
MKKSLIAYSALLGLACAGLAHNAYAGGGPFNMMNPSKWFGGSDRYDDDYYRDRYYDRYYYGGSPWGYGPGGYGGGYAPGWGGYGGPWGSGGGPWGGGYGPGWGGYGPWGGNNGSAQSAPPPRLPE